MTELTHWHQTWSMLAPEPHRESSWIHFNNYLTVGQPATCVSHIGWNLMGFFPCTYNTQFLTKTSTSQIVEQVMKLLNLVVLQWQLLTHSPVQCRSNSKAGGSSMNFSCRLGNCRSCVRSRTPEQSPCSVSLAGSMSVLGSIHQEHHDLNNLYMRYSVHPTPACGCITSLETRWACLQTYSQWY